VRWAKYDSLKVVKIQERWWMRSERADHKNEGENGNSWAESRKHILSYWYAAWDKFRSRYAVYELPILEWKEA